MRTVTIEKHHSMRTRSKSLVKSIALDGPAPYDTRKPEYQPKLHKSNSIPSFENHPLIDRLYPFSENEATALQREIFDINFSVGNITLQEEMESMKTPQIENFLMALDINLNQLNSHKSLLNEISNELDNIENKYFKINQSTGEFSSQSIKLVQKQQEMNEKYQSINMILKNFETLNDITKKLSVPNNAKLIKSKTFNKILNDLNNSLNFINDENFQNFKNIDTYKIKFRQCMTRVLTLIKDYLNNELKKIDNNIKYSTKNDQELINIAVYDDFDNYIEDYSEVFYNFPNLINIFMIRIIENGEVEYQGLLLEIFQNYFQIRINLIKFDGWKFDTEELIKFTQDNLLIIKKMLTKEFQLLQHFFGLVEIPNFINNEIYSFFKDLIDPFYDSIRLKILKELNIGKLCQLTTLLQNYYEYEEIGDAVNFQEILDPILSEVQSRLIFRIQLYIDNKLLPYKPSPEDLKIGSSNLNNKRKNSLNEEFDDNLFPELYLPLGKALTILSNIYELVNSVVFDDLAHYIVHSCIEILQNSLKISESNLGKINAKLYYLKNLIILKYQLTSFDIKFIRNDYSIDFTSGLNELYSAIRNGEILVTLNSGVFELIKKSLPKIINNMIDAKLEIEVELNNIINELLKDFLNLIIQDLSKFEEFKLNLPTRLNDFKVQIINYLNDLNFLKILFNNLSEILINYYLEFYDNLKDKREFMEPEVFIRYLSDITDDLVNDDNLQNNLMDIKPLLKFDEELDNMVNDTPSQKSTTSLSVGPTDILDAEDSNFETATNEAKSSEPQQIQQSTDTKTNPKTEHENPGINLETSLAVE